MAQLKQHNSDDIDRVLKKLHALEKVLHHFSIVSQMKCDDASIKHDLSEGITALNKKNNSVVRKALVLGLRSQVPLSLFTLYQSNALINHQVSKTAPTKP